MSGNKITVGDYWKSRGSEDFLKIVAMTGLRGYRDHLQVECRQKPITNHNDFDTPKIVSHIRQTTLLQTRQKVEKQEVPENWINFFEKDSLSCLVLTKGEGLKQRAIEQLLNCKEEDLPKV